MAVGDGLAEKQLVAAFAGDARVRVLTEEDVRRQYPVAARFDPYGNSTAHVPYTPAMFAALATVTVRAVHAAATPRPKVIVVDADNTLWDGVVGEDGALGVVVGPARRAFQEFLLEQRAAGRLLCLCSKNVESDVLDVLSGHPDMLLRTGHLAAMRVNWAPKSANVHELAAELSLGVDSFVFLDDNPVECAEVEAGCPGTLALRVPADAEAVVPFLRHCWPLDIAEVTAEDRERADRYRAERQRDAARTQAPSLETFLATLELTVDVRPLADADLARAAQLTRRTNQFNLTTVRRGPAELASLPAGLRCHVVDVRDRFGDYGQVGVVVAGVERDALVVETFLVSCRVLGRGVEHRILAAIAELAGAEGRTRVVLPYEPTERNQPALRFLESLPAHRVDTATGARFELAVAAEITPRYEEKPVAVTVVEAAAERETDWAYIATTLATAEQVLAAIDARRGAPVSTVVTDDPVEAAVAAIWARLLDFPPRSVHDNFFDLGGHSMLIVRFATAVRDEFGVELAIDELFTAAFTVADIARTVRQRQLDSASETELADLLDELDQLSDDEIRAMLDLER
ncbi:HAD-IIIC family phosphatase [Virgisporangium aurantiacum]|uniref:HAD-IIIC family phosphatase n=1 Tax=Virgisporangium aurantiacum TaxID=175570 RepID=UPI001950243B|nr:HAD-IIIC family phosphatase [Virgisporangium aurantiacum]